ncbi:ubiquitin-conjugating enzyme domain-containing protein [Sarocladium implicatum]|nr:ubiquitin-conjugating enzyme domain-containing protein [Sarocladium implicatum]
MWFGSVLAHGHPDLAGGMFPYRGSKDAPSPRTLLPHHPALAPALVCVWCEPLSSRLPSLFLSRTFLPLPQPLAATSFPSSACIVSSSSQAIIAISESLLAARSKRHPYSKPRQGTRLTPIERHPRRRHRSDHSCLHHLSRQPYKVTISRLLTRSQSVYSTRNHNVFQQELAEATQSPPEGITVTLPPSQAIHTWHVTLAAPPNSIYSPGRYGLLVNLPADYPFKPPVVRFTTRIYHPNVTNDSLGNICLGILKPENWKPSTKIAAVLEAVRQLLSEPAPDDPLEERIADEYRNDRPAFEKTAKMQVEKYALVDPEFPATAGP